jgi:predicted integral membrane protein DUF2269
MRAMDTYLLVKTLHIISATIVFGTGIGIANFMFLGHFSPDPAARAFAAQNTARGSPRSNGLGCCRRAKPTCCAGVAGATVSRQVNDVRLPGGP